MTKWNNWYYDTNAGEAVSLDQLRADYEQFKTDEYNYTRRGR